MPTIKINDVALSVNPGTLVLAGHGPALSILAGGTDLLIELRRATKKAPKVVLDISGMSVLGGIDESELFEWGGRNKRGDWEFSQKRPGWDM